MIFFWPKILWPMKKTEVERVCNFSQRKVSDLSILYLTQLLIPSEGNRRTFSSDLQRLKKWCFSLRTKLLRGALQQTEKKRKNLPLQRPPPLCSVLQMEGAGGACHAQEPWTLAPDLGSFPSVPTGPAVPRSKPNEAMTSLLIKWRNATYIFKKMIFFVVFTKSGLSSICHFC